MGPFLVLPFSGGKASTFYLKKNEHCPKLIEKAGLLCLS